MFLSICAGLAVSSGADAAPEDLIGTLGKRLKVQHAPIADPQALEKTRAKLAAKQTTRILHLGDSHVAADLITKTIRRELQARHGNGGRGFTPANQRATMGGRRVGRESGWVRDRIVDRGRAGRRYGFSGFSYESKKAGAKLSYKIAGGDAKLRVYYEAQPKGAKLTVKKGNKTLGEIDTKAEVSKSRVETFVLDGKKGKVDLIAGGKHARVYGLSFESADKGVVYDPIGPVGADAKVYLQLDQKSFHEHLASHAPDLIIFMVGGNDALKIRKKWTTLEKVRKDHRDLIDSVKKAVPGVECMLWTPMDAGKKKGKKVVSKPGLGAIRAMQIEVAKEKGCAVWDLYTAMGGDGSITRWAKARIMNADLVHPKSKAAELLGQLFVDAWTKMPEK